jgi:Flp pilus assembly pilin Flp
MCEHHPGHCRTSGGAHVIDFFIRLDIIRRRERGQTMAEYVVVLGIISVGILAALGLLTNSVSGALGKVSSKI